jgi:hypothetical protein
LPDGSLFCPGKFRRIICTYLNTRGKIEKYKEEKNDTIEDEQDFYSGCCVHGNAFYRWTKGK